MNKRQQNLSNQLFPQRSLDRRLAELCSNQFIPEIRKDLTTLMLGAQLLTLRFHGGFFHHLGSLP